MTDGRSHSRGLRESVKAAIDADRLAVICSLWRGPATARMLAEGSGVDLTRVRYILRRWRETGIVEIDESRRPPGRRSISYRLRPGKLTITNEEADRVSPEQLRRARIRTLGLTLQQARGLADRGLFGGEEGHAGFRLPISLDPASQQRAVGYVEETLASVAAIGEEAWERLRAGPSPGTPAAVCLSFSERPPVKNAALDKVELAPPSPKGRGPRNVKAPGALEDPLTFEIEYLLLARPYTVAELATELSVGSASIRRSLARLKAGGFAKVFAVRATRGAAEKSYVGEPLARFNQGTPGKVGEQRRKDYERWVIGRVAREAVAAARSDQLGASNAAFGWLPLLLDRKGFGEVDHEIDRLSYKMLDLRSDCLAEERWRSPGALSSSLRSLFFSVENCDPPVFSDPEGPFGSHGAPGL